MAAKRKSLKSKPKAKQQLKKKPVRSVRAKSRAAPKPRRSVRKPAKKPAVDPRDTAVEWFAKLSARIEGASVEALQALIAEARQYDLVGLEQLLGDHDQVLEINKAANALIEAGLAAFGAASPVGFQLQVLRDILNDS